MKLRLLGLVAAATVAMGAQGVAQQSGDLERALADLNNGLNTPLAGGVTASGSTSLDISGDARARNIWWNPAGAPADQKAIDVRVRLNFAFAATETSRAFVSINGHEGWGNGTSAANGLLAKGTEPNSFLPGSNLADTGSIEQAYFEADNLIGDGGTAKIGRSHFTVGSGRIIGTDDWDQDPFTFSGIWYHNGFNGWNVNVFMTNEVKLGQINGGNGIGDTDLFGLTFDYTLEDLPTLGTLMFQPYILRMSNRTASPDTYVNWYGTTVDGSMSNVTYNGEIVWMRTKALSRTDTAWALNASVDLGEMMSGLPGGFKPTLELGAASAENNVTVAPVYHKTAGLYDLLGRGGVWGGMASTWQAGVGFEPMEGWNGRIGYVNFNQKNQSGMDGNEWDVSVGKTLNGNVDAWIGYAYLDRNAVAANDYIVYATLSLPF